MCKKKLSARTDYCCVCRTNEHYSLDELDNIKHHHSFKLQKFFLSILRDVAEILSLDPTVAFWKSNYYNWICFTPSSNGGVECVDQFRLNLAYYFSLKDINWHPVDYWVRKLKLFTNVTKLLKIFWERVTTTGCEIYTKVVQQKGIAWQVHVTTVASAIFLSVILFKN